MKVTREDIEKSISLTKQGKADKVPKEILRLLANKVQLTTEGYPKGLEITDRFGTVSEMAVSGFHFGREWLAGFSDFFGGRSGTTENVFKNLTKDTDNQLKMEAARRGGNYIIAVDYKHFPISSKNQAMLACVANGTVVRIESEVKEV